MLNVFGTIYAEWNQTTTAPKSIQNFKNKKFNLIQSSINLQKPSHSNKKNFQKYFLLRMTNKIFYKKNSPN